MVESLDPKCVHAWQHTFYIEKAALVVLLHDEFNYALKQTAL